MTEPEVDPVGPRRPTPIGGDMAAIIWGLAQRLRIPALTKRHHDTTVMGLFAGVNGLIAIAIVSAVAWATGQPFIFPSLGPTAFLLFYTPGTAAASPRNTIIGHAVGAGAGYLALVIFGLTNDPPALATEVTGGRVGAAAVSLALTSAVMVWLRAPHPPAGATTLIVSLGILRDIDQLAILMLAVVLLTAQGFVINRLAGITYPIWKVAPSPPWAGPQGGTPR
jgi:CBS-domain-containing membrane protein